ncbi:hypothetical protein [Flavobacterium cerinum]|uniref:Polymer-forming cytoskeletal protein n=1 Tax=Flavobacterium cerinum TaxID=2502784 RepID=A0ABY5IUJ5_9FLAO|nr:hypothetical protein [Flavobacterium cerinum]UUC46501.1 hypothetical protein NOX80_04700 [Flavobacterium cerinum]
MVKAHSLLYAVYICLIVSIICGALLYFSGLYNQLNLFYNLQEELYIHNQSVVNYALGNKLADEAFPTDEASGVQGEYRVKQYGLLNVLTASTILRNDTVVSVHLVGSYSKDKTAIHLANLSRSLRYSGTVRLNGDNKLPSTFIETSFLNNRANQLTVTGQNTVSEIKLPEINAGFKKIFEGIKTEKIALSQFEKKDSLYFNSFQKETKEMEVGVNTLSNLIVKGNFVLRAKDSIVVGKNAVLEDVILIAPKITFESGFKGTVQAFATKGIELQEEVNLKYPSVVCVYNNTDGESKLKIKKECKIEGAIVLFGSSILTINKNSIEIDEKSVVMGDIYCTGKLDLKSDIQGSVYTNLFFYKNGSSINENMIVDIEIDPKKRPDYFMAIPLFEAKKNKYGVIKKVL